MICFYNSHINSLMMATL